MLDFSVIVQSMSSVLAWLLLVPAFILLAYSFAQLVYLLLNKAQDVQRQQTVSHRLKSADAKRISSDISNAADAVTSNTAVASADMPATLPLLSKTFLVRNYCLRSEQGKRLLGLLDRAGLSSKSEGLLQWWLLLVGLLTLFALVFSSLLLSLVVVFLAAVGSFAYLQGRVDKRKQALRASIPDMLDELAQSLRAGRSFPQSLNYVLNAQSPDSVLIDLLRRLDADARLGRNCAKSLKELSTASGLRELKSVAAVLEISSRVGGSTPSLFEQIATSIRQDLMLNNKLKVQTAQGRSSVRLVGAVPFALIGLMSLLMPGYLRLWLSTLGGQALFALSMLLVAVGFYWVRTVVNIHV